MSHQKVLPPTYLYVAIAIMIALHFRLPGPAVISSPWNLLGVMPFALGAALNLIADRVFKQHDTTVKPFKQSTTLVTDGVYRISRHPMYLGFVLMLIGVATFMGSLTPYAVVVVFAILMDVVFIRVEERMLEEQFGDAWQEYTARVRRWI